VRGIAADPALPRRRRLAVASLAFALVHDRLHALTDHASIGDALPRGGGALATLWTPVVLAMLTTAIHQLSDARRGTAYDCVARHVIGAALLSSVLLLGFEVGLSLVLPAALALAVIAADAYRRIYREILARRAATWLGPPFALLAGYAGMVAVVAAGGAIAWTGCQSSAPASALVIGAGAAASHLGLRHRDVVMPWLVAWLLVGICAADPPAGLAGAALLMTAICATVGIVTTATVLASRPFERDERRVSRPRRAAWPSPSPRSHRA
jgi:hypothetical protein